MPKTQLSGPHPLPRGKAPTRQQVIQRRVDPKEKKEFKHQILDRPGGPRVAVLRRWPCPACGLAPGGAIIAATSASASATAAATTAAAAAAATSAAATTAAAARTTTGGKGEVSERGWGTHGACAQSPRRTTAWSARTRHQRRACARQGPPARLPPAKVRPPQAARARGHARAVDVAAARRVPRGVGLPQGVRPAQTTAGWPAQPKGHPRGRVALLRRRG